MGNLKWLVEGAPGKGWRAVVMVRGEVVYVTTLCDTPEAAERLAVAYALGDLWRLLRLARREKQAAMKRLKTV